MTNWIKPLHAGKLKLEHNLIQGPLAGVSCAPYRVLANQFQRPAYSCTEMISAIHLVHARYQRPRFLYRSEEESVVSYQLSGASPDIIARATEIVAQNGADLIDLNCGCPKPKIRSKGTGSALLANPELVYQLVNAMHNATDAVVTIKIRVDGDSDDRFNEAITDAAVKGGAGLITVHGRHWTDDYTIPIFYEQIKTIKSSCSIPIIANGDVNDFQSCLRLFEKTNCDGVMISRGCMGRPWLFAEIIAAFLNQPYNTPSSNEIFDLFLQHLEGLAKLENEAVALLQSRRFIKYYLKSYHNMQTLIEQFHSCKTINDAKALFKTFS